MTHRCLGQAFLAALMLPGFLPAQVTNTPVIPSTPVMLQQSLTTGMVGFTTGQTARLNVLNLYSLPAATTTPTTPTANCTVELQFFDDKNNMLKQTVVSNLAPGTATSLDLPRTSVTSVTASRAEIRGVVVVNPTSGPIVSPVAVGFCSVFTTLEIFDGSGSTVSLTSDTRPIGLPVVVPLTARGAQ